MPHRTMTIWIGLCGLLAVFVLVLLGRNVERSAARGPRWKRRILAAGMGLMAALGFLPSCKPSPTKQGSTNAEGTQTAPQKTNRARHLSRQSRQQVRKVSDWRSMVAVFERAEAVASQPSGSYPFDRAGKKKLLADIDAAGQVARKLAESGRITKPEADLLVTELTILRQRVAAFRSKEMQMATCYEPRLLRPIDETKDRLKQRLTALDHLTTQKSIHPEVLALVRTDIERDMAKLDQLTRSRPARDKVRTFLAKIRKVWKALQDRARQRPR